MNNALPITYLARYGETAWTITGQHTGRTDLTLTERGEANADRVGSRLRAELGNVLIFSSGHFLRVPTARWIGLEPINGRSLMLGTASLSALGSENSISRPAIRLWNDINHVIASDGQDAPWAHASAPVCRQRGTG